VSKRRHSSFAASWVPVKIRLLGLGAEHQLEQACDRILQGDAIGAQEIVASLASMLRRGCEDQRTNLPTTSRQSIVGSDNHTCDDPPLVAGPEPSRSAEDERVEFTQASNAMTAGELEATLCPTFACV